MEPTNPDGVWFENPIITYPVRLQGYGPGGQNSAENVAYIGTVLDGRLTGGDAAAQANWEVKAEQLVADLIGTSDPAVCHMRDDT